MILDKLVLSQGVHPNRQVQLVKEDIAFVPRKVYRSLGKQMIIPDNDRAWCPL